MKTIDRRTFLGSLAFSGIHASTAAPTHTAQSDTGSHQHKPEKDLVWTVVQHHPKPSNDIHFWSMPTCTVPYGSELDPRVTRGTLFLHYEGEDLDSHSSLKYVDALLGQDRASWMARNCSCRGSISDALSLVLGDSKLSENATALVALDSRGVGGEEVAWHDILPALRRHYPRIIGHFHIPDRGFHHWKTRLSQNNKEAFSGLFTRAASQCDAVIFTSQSLLENDTYLPARGSTDMLVAELMTRLCRGLENNGVLEQMSALQGKQPRMFALGSAGAHRHFASLNLADLARQREIVFASFGKPLARPLLVGLDLARTSEAKLQNQIAGSNLVLLAARSRVDEVERLDPEWFKLFVLWPFDPDYGPWPSP